VIHKKVGVKRRHDKPKICGVFTVAGGRRFSRTQAHATVGNAMTGTGRGLRQATTSTGAYVRSTNRRRACCLSSYVFLSSFSEAGATQPRHGAITAMQNMINCMIKLASPRRDVLNPFLKTMGYKKIA